MPQFNKDEFLRKLKAENLPSDLMAEIEDIVIRYKQKKEIDYGGIYKIRDEIIDYCVSIYARLLYINIQQDWQIYYNYKPYYPGFRDATLDFYMFLFQMGNARNAHGIEASRDKDHTRKDDNYAYQRYLKGFDEEKASVLSEEFDKCLLEMDMSPVGKMERDKEHYKIDIDSVETKCEKFRKLLHNIYDFHVRLLIRNNMMESDYMRYVKDSSIKRLSLLPYYIEKPEKMRVETYRRNKDISKMEDIIRTLIEDQASGELSIRKKKILLGHDSIEGFVEYVRKIQEIDKLKTEREALSATYEEKLKQKTNKENPKQGKGGITRELKAQRAKSFDKAKSIVSARLKGLDYNNVADLQKAIQIYRDAIKELE